MSSGGSTYEETLPAYAEGPLARGEALPAAEVATEPSASLDRGRDWPLVFAFFTPLVAAYAAIAYALYLVIGAI